MPMQLLDIKFRMVPLRNRTIIVTGANIGIGLYSSANLAKLGANVIMACRNLDKAKAAREQIVSTVPEAANRITVRNLDLADLASVREFANGILRDGITVDVLINNAGLVPPLDKKLTKDGYELAFQTNHLGHFLLTNLLLPSLEKSTFPARIVNVASTLAKNGKLEFDNLNSERAYAGAGPTYNNSKLLNTVFTTELALRLAANPSTSHIRALTICPGFIWTQLGTNSHWLVGPLIMYWMRIRGGARPTHEGALSSVFAAASVEAGEVPAGETRFYDSYGKDQGLPSVCADGQGCKRLWEESARMVGGGVRL